MGGKKNKKKRKKQPGAAEKVAATQATEVIVAPQIPDSEAVQVPSTTPVIGATIKSAAQVVGRRTSKEIEEEARSVTGGHASSNVREYMVGSHSGLPKVTDREIPSRYTKALEAGVPMPAPGATSFKRAEPYKPPLVDKEVAKHWKDRRSLEDEVDSSDVGVTWGLLFRLRKALGRLIGSE